MAATAETTREPERKILCGTSSFAVSVLRTALLARGNVILNIDWNESAEPREVSETVLHRARRGDRDAFVALICHYDRRLRSLAYRLLDDREEMTDAMQDVYVKVFRSLRSFKGRSTVGTWLYRITYTTCLDHLAQRRSAAVTYDDTEPARLDLVDDPADVVELRADLSATLRTLTSGQRAVVLMIDRDGYDYRMAADVLGVPIGTIASRLSAAREVLRRELEKEVLS